MAGTPVVLSDSEAGAGRAHEVQVWDRFLDTGPMNKAERVARLSDTPDAGASARRAPIDTTLPDAGMINKPADKLRARIVKA